MFGLNDAEIEIIAGAVRKRDYYYKSPLGSRLFELNLGRIALAITAVSSREDIARVKAIIAEHGEIWPFRWLEQNGVRDVSA